MKCIINENKQITAFYKNDSDAPKNAVVCDKIYPISSFLDNENNIKYIYKLTDGKVTSTTDGSTYIALQYARNREEAYPSIANQLDDLYHNGIDGWKTTIKAIKDKHPKE
jgi:hypothetical protein